MKIAVAQINPIIGDFNTNFEKIKQFAERAAACSCDLVVFSELVVPGYPPRDLLDESRYFQPGRECTSYLYKGHRIGLTICEDAWNDKDIFTRRIYDIDPLELMAQDFEEDLVELGFDPKLVEEVITKVDRNEYKRHQAAPGLKVTSKAFGYGRRYPMAQRYSAHSFSPIKILV